MQSGNSIHVLPTHFDHQLLLKNIIEKEQV